jgi:hypothetical protein
MALFADLPLARIAVVYANNKSNSGAVIHPTANTRHWKVSGPEGRVSVKVSKTQLWRFPSTEQRPVSNGHPALTCFAATTIEHRQHDLAAN